MKITKLSSPGTYTLDTEQDNISILVLADLHIGSKDFSEEVWKYYENWLDVNPDTYIMLNGDIIEAGQRNSVGNSIYNSILSPQEQVEAAEALIDKYKDRLIAVLEGNHELRIRRQTGINPISLVTPKDVIYLDYNSPLKLQVFDKNIWMHHGKGSSTTESSKIAKAKRLWSYRPDIDLQIYSHWHSYFEYYQVTKLFTGETKDRAMVVTGSTLRWEDSYAEASYSPGRAGMPLITIANNRPVKIKRISPETEEYTPILAKNQKLSEEQVELIRYAINNKVSHKDIAEEYGISKAMVDSISVGRRR